MLTENIALSFVIAAVLIIASLILFPVLKRKNRIMPVPAQPAKPAKKAPSSQ
jgi:hypothetical protein